MRVANESTIRNSKMRDLDRKRERERDHVCDRSFNGQTTRQQKQQILKNPQTHTHARTHTHTRALAIPMLVNTYTPRGTSLIH